jgi:predicted MFS family arabinose efflux permease
VVVVVAATYLFSVLTIVFVVRAGKRVEQTAQSRGLLAGLRFLANDRLLGPILLAACAINLVAQGLIVAVQGLAYFRYSQDAHVVGYLFAAFGIGALLGAIAAQSLTQKVDLLKLAAVAIVAMPLPLWLLAVPLPWGAAMVVLAAFGFFTPLVNAPIIGVLTVRTPPALRPKVMTSVMTVATLAGPVGFLAAGEALRYYSLTQVLVGIAAAFTLCGLAFATLLLRNRDAPPASAPATA